MKVKNFTGDFEALLWDAEEGAVTDRARKFVEDINARYEEYGDDTYISESQLEWLKLLGGRER